MKTVTQERLKELFEYSDGDLIRRISVGNNAPAGVKVGSTRESGYLSVVVDCKRYLVHRLVYMYHHSYMPEGEIDHIDRDRSNNRIENLREVSRTCNLRNTGNPITNTSGVKGVSYNKVSGKWRARMSINNVDKFIGYHKDFEEAVLHRLAAEQCLGWDGCDDNSPAYRYYKENIECKD